MPNSDEKLQKFIDTLIDRNGINLENFNGSYDGPNKGDEHENERSFFSRRANELWYQLIYHLQNGVYNIDLSKKHYGIRENDFPKDSNLNKAVAQFISEKADLDLNLFKDANVPQDFFELYINSKGTGDNEKSHWNESIAKLADYYHSIFYENTLGNQFVNNSGLKYKNLKIADAGYSFTNASHFVEPNNNNEIKDLEQETYKTYMDIRGKDAIINVLKNMSKLQFTSKKKDIIKINQYMRLIMPEYKRIVEIEDLNRNFWVIGQALTVLFSFLFDDDSIYPALLNALLDEIIQLWENIFYLWICITITSQEQKPYEDIKVLFMPVSSNNYYDGLDAIKIDDIKFDNFVGNYYFDTSYYITTDNEAEQINKEIIVAQWGYEILEDIWNDNMYYLKNKYDNCALIIIPEIRNKNYAHNYYARAIYPGIIIYDDSIPDSDTIIRFIPFKYPIGVNVEDQIIHYKEEDT